MAESICRTLRDGALDGEHAPALTIKDSIDSPFRPYVFNNTQLSAYILAGKSQSHALLLVALSRSPSFFVDLLSRGYDVTSLRKWPRFWIVIHILSDGRTGTWSVELLPISLLKLQTQ